MKHLFSLFLVFSLLSSVILFTVSCAPAKEDRPDENPAPTPGGPTDTDDSKIYVPPFENLTVPLIKRVERDQYTRDNPHKTRIVIAALKNDAGIIGAAGLGK